MRIVPFIAAAALAAGCAADRPRTAEAPSRATAPAAPACDPAPKALIVRDTQVGTGKEVQVRSAVLVGYTGWLYDPKAAECKGLMFDTSTGRPAPFGVMVGAGRVIKGWDQGLVGMREKGKRTLIIPADMAYGAKGAGDKIPPGATLIFDIELHQIIADPPPTPSAPPKPAQ